MSGFKYGDKVKVVKCSFDGAWYNNQIGSVFTLTYGPDSDGDWEIEEQGGWFLAECDIELVEEEKEMFDMKTQPWFIRVNSKEEYDAANNWVKGETGNYLLTPYFKDIIQITNTVDDGKIWSTVMFVDDDTDREFTCHEIKLTFKTVVDSVEYPVVESEAQKELKKLQQQIEELQKQADKLKGTIK